MYQAQPLVTVVSETFQVIQWYLVLHCTDETSVGAWLPWPDRKIPRMRLTWVGIPNTDLVCLICHAMCSARGAQRSYNALPANSVASALPCSGPLARIETDVAEMH